MWLYVVRYSQLTPQKYKDGLARRMADVKSKISRTFDVKFLTCLTSKDDFWLRSVNGVVVVVVVSHIQRIGCQPEKKYFTRWPIPLVVC